MPNWKNEIICLLLRMTGIPWLLRELYARHKVTIINYHDPAPDVFEKHMQLFSRSYSFIHIADLAAALEEKDFSDLPAKPLLVTLDDGHKGNARLFGIIKKYKVPAVLYVTAGVVNSNRHFWFKLTNLNKLQIDNLKNIPDDERREWLKGNLGHEDDREYKTSHALSLDELRQAISIGGTIASHTLFHPELDKCSDEVGLKECSESRSCLEALVGKPVQHFAYPSGGKDERTKKWLIQAGYRTARTIHSGWITVESNPLKLPNFGISDNAGINKAIVQTSGLWDMIKNMFKSKK